MSFSAAPPESATTLVSGKPRRLNSFIEIAGAFAHIWVITQSARYRRTMSRIWALISSPGEGTLQDFSSNPNCFCNFSKIGKGSRRAGFSHYRYAIFGVAVLPSLAHWSMTNLTAPPVCDHQVAIIGNT